ncbi:sensor histidine kinase [Novispirillum sp. DQ9]|uniref:sensor histidine kinase n=1 Tax=Novispirillum sp. DQ9 TaxID=3398612 RepID=UPI003C7A528B
MAEGMSAADLQRVGEVLRRLARTTTLAEVMASVTAAARPLLGADGVTFILRQGDQCFYAEEDALSPLWKGLRFPIGACVSGWCMSHGLPAVIEDIATDPRVPADAYHPTFVRSLAMVPVPVEAPVAAVGAYWGRRHAATEREVSLLEMLANLSSLAMASADCTASRIAAEAEREHQRTLVGEISHRVKNTLAVVQAMALQTARTAPSLEVFKETFLARLTALGAAHGLLVQEDWRDVPLRDLVSATINHVAQPGARVSMRGDDIRLSPRAHLSMAMALHELAINAVRHGALTRAEGSLHVHWQRDDTASRGCMLAFTWEERGAAAGGPLLPGFGLTLVERLVRQDLRGDCTLERLPPRLVWKLAIPCTEIMQPADILKPAVERRR